MDHRVISPIEMYSVARHNIDFYKSVIFYLRFRISKFSLIEWKSQIEQSLRLTIEAHPRLCLQVDQSRKEAYYVILPMNVFDILPIRIVERTNDDDENEEFLIKILEDESNTGFIYNQSSPLWRVVLVVSSNSDILDFIVTFDHAIGDGMSGMAFLTTFVDYLSQKSSPIFSLSNDPPSYKLIPSNLPPLPSLILEIIEKLLLPNFLRQYFFPKTYWTGNIQSTDHQSNQTRLISFELSNTILDLLHKKCQIEQTTIHSAILASLLLSITEIFGDKKNMEFLCGTAVDIRPYCQPVISNRQMGMFNSGVDSYHYIPFKENFVDLFWILARQIKEQITREIKHSALPMIQSLKFVSNWNEVLMNLRKTLPNGCQNSIDISNILRWSFESNDESWKILHGGFLQSANVIGSVFTASVVTVNGILKIFICFQENKIENIEQVKIMVDKMKQFLIEVSSF